MAVRTLLPFKNSADVYLVLYFSLGTKGFHLFSFLCFHNLCVCIIERLLLKNYVTCSEFHRKLVNKLRELAVDPVIQFFTIILWS